MPKLSPDFIKQKKNAQNIGICALYLSILEGYTWESALEYIESGEKPKKKEHRFNTTDDVVDMIILRERQEMTYREIGELYNLRPDNVYRKIKRFRERKDTEDMKKLKDAGFYYREIGDFYDLVPQAIYDRFRREDWFNNDKVE